MAWEALSKAGNIADLASLFFDFRNWSSVGRLASVFTRRGTTAGSGSAGTTTNDGTLKAKDDGKGLDDEWQFLIAAAEAYGRDLFGQDITQVDPEVIKAELARNRIKKFNDIGKALRTKSGPGAVAKLMHIIGRESHLQGQTHKQSRKPGQKPVDPAAPIEYLQAKHRTNPSGQLIMLYLTSMGVDEAVDLLMDWSITDNSRDTAAAAAKAAADKAGEVWNKVKEKDMDIHLWLSSLETSSEEIERIQASAPYQRLKADLDAATTPEVKHQRKEALKRFVRSMVKNFQSPATQAHKARAAGKRTPEETDKRLTRIFVTIIVVGVIILGVAAKFNLYQ